MKENTSGRKRIGSWSLGEEAEINSVCELASKREKMGLGNGLSPIDCSHLQTLEMVGPTED